MTLTVHGAAYTVTTQRVLISLAELGVDDYKLELVDVIKGAHKSPEFLKIQPFARVPALQDGDFIIFESRAIAMYLAEKFKGQGTALLGKTPKEKAFVNQWLEVESQNYNPHIATIIDQIIIGPIYGGKCDDEVVSEQMVKLEKVLDVYEDHMSKNKYLAGDFFSLADLSHIPYTNLLVNAAGKGDAIASRPHVSAWWNDISSRPSFQKVLALQKH